jgi:hypothetical protein
MNYKEIKAMAQAWNTVQEAKFSFDIPEDIGTMERTAFHGAAAGAHKAGKSSFNFNGKKYPVTMKKDTAKAIADEVKPAVKKALAKASAASEKGKKAVTLPKAPFKMDEAQSPAQKAAFKKMLDMKKGKKVDDEDEADKDDKEVKEAATHKPNNGQEMGDGLSPSAKAQLANKTPMPDDVDGPAINKKSFDAMRKSLKTAPKRAGDNDAGEKNIKPSATPVKMEVKTEAVMSADKKPEKYVKPDGKIGIRMVRTDKEVVNKDK